MRQLSLFDDLLPREERAPDPVVPEVGAQLDLFADRMLLLAAARSRLAALDPVGARRTLRESLHKYPADERLAEEGRELDGLAFQVERALAASSAVRTASLVTVAAAIEPLSHEGARHVPDRPFPHRALRDALLRRAAAESIERAGDVAPIAGYEPGWLFLLAGDLELARASLERAVQATDRPRSRALLGECVRRLGDDLLARQLFFSAFLANPYDVDLSAIGDPAVRDLPSVARHRLEIEDDPLAWTAPVGVVTGIFHLPMWTLEHRPPSLWGAPALTEPQRASLSNAAAFLEALARARSKAGPTAVIAARREMKRLQPMLFEVVMGRAPE